jgi:hypothetical protein
MNERHQRDLSVGEKSRRGGTTARRVGDNLQRVADDRRDVPRARRAHDDRACRIGDRHGDRQRQQLGEGPRDLVDRGVDRGAEQGRADDGVRGQDQSAESRLPRPLFSFA